MHNDEGKDYISYNCNGLLASYRREIIVKSYDWVSPYLTDSTSKLANIIKHGYNVCRLKHNENQGRMAYCNEKHIKTKLTYSVIPYSVFSGVPVKDQQSRWLLPLHAILIKDSNTNNRIFHYSGSTSLTILYTSMSRYWHSVYSIWRLRFIYSMSYQLTSRKSNLSFSTIKIPYRMHGSFCIICKINEMNV